MNADEREAAIDAKEAEMRASGFSERLSNFKGYYDRASRPMSFVRWVATVEADPESRIVGRDILEDGTLVSTVWLGMDHRHRFGSELDEGAPLIFETMIFGPDKDNPFDDYQERYAALDEALAGHRRAIEIAKEAGD